MFRFFLCHCWWCCCLPLLCGRCCTKTPYFCVPVYFFAKRFYCNCEGVLYPPPHSRSRVVHRPSRAPLLRNRTLGYDETRVAHDQNTSGLSQTAVSPLSVDSDLSSSLLCPLAEPFRKHVARPANSLARPRSVDCCHEVPDVIVDERRGKRYIMIKALPVASKRPNQKNRQYTWSLR